MRNNTLWGLFDAAFVESNGRQVATRREIESIPREIGQAQHGVATRAQLIGYQITVVPPLVT
ncbi:MAG: hypothetical protein ACREMA_14565 [Longimicrobiales bacterium]